jgi:hypothetical protein
MWTEFKWHRMGSKKRLGYKNSLTSWTTISYDFRRCVLHWVGSSVIQNAMDGLICQRSGSGSDKKTINCLRPRYHLYLLATGGSTQQEHNQPRWDEWQPGNSLLVYCNTGHQPKRTSRNYQGLVLGFEYKDGQKNRLQFLRCTPQYLYQKIANWIKIQKKD